MTEQETPTPAPEGTHDWKGSTAEYWKARYFAEAEAAARQVTELRAAVEAWPESWTRTIGAKFVRNRILDLLSAGDKAEAPR